MNGINVEISWEQVDQIVIDQLKFVVEDILRDPWGIYHSYSKSLETVDAALLTLNYFIRDAEHELYKLSIQESYDQLVSLAEPLKAEDFV